MKISCTSQFIHSIMVLAEGHSISFIAGAIAKEVGKTVLVTDAANRVLTIHSPVGGTHDVGAFFPLEPGKNDKIKVNYFSEENGLSEGQWQTKNGPVSYVYLQLKVPGSHYGNLIVLSSLRGLTATQKMTIQQVAITILLALKAQLDQETERTSFMDEIVYDVLYNNYDSKLVLYEKAKHLHWSVDGPYGIAVVDVPLDKILAAKKTGPSQFNSFKPVYTIINEKIVVILSLINLPNSSIKGAITEFGKEYLSNLNYNFIKDVRMGIGAVGNSLADLYKGYQEAKIAVELSRAFDMGSICFFDEMGFLKFIFTAPAEELQEFKNRILWKVVAYDLEMGTDLLNTLRTYVDRRAQVASSAKSLFIHENTLRNRLKKIEELLDMDLNQVDHLVNIYIALQISNMDDYGEN
ncbi:MAG: helix-turn-helix domain-containing protein [Bacillota bacterium]